MENEYKIKGQIQLKPAEILLNARNYVKDFFAKSNLTVAEAKALPHLHASMKLDYDELFTAFKAINQSKAKGLKWAEIDAALEEYFALEVIKERKAATEALVCTGETLDLVKAFITASTGKLEPLDVGVLAHWIWQVKRRAFDKKVVWHIMPVFYGPQGSGKSSAIKQMLSPIHALYSEMALDSLSDDRLYKAFGDYLVLFFDELQQIKKSNMETLKHQISTDINSYRPMRTNDMVNVPMRASCIGASNKPLSESFSDPTGMRRFYEMETVAQFPIETINAIDYLAMWKGIDENREQGYLTPELRTQLFNKQEALVDKEPLDEFIAEMQLKPSKPHTTKNISKDELYRAYVIWCGNNGVHATSSQWVTKRLIKRKFRVIKEGTASFFEVNAECEPLKFGVSK